MVLAILTSILQIVKSLFPFAHRFRSFGMATFIRSKWCNTKWKFTRRILKQYAQPPIKQDRMTEFEKQKTDRMLIMTVIKSAQMERATTIVLDQEKDGTLHLSIEY